MTRHAYLSDGVALSELQRYARQRRGERTQIHKHPHTEGMPEHTSYEIAHAVYDCSEFIEGEA